jgi:hypothetical protein
MHLQMTLALLPALLALAATPALGAPMLALDMDRSAPGIQSDLTVTLDQVFDVDVLLDTDGESVGGFEFELFPGAIPGLAATATNIVVHPIFGDTDASSSLDAGGAARAEALLGLFGSPVSGTGLRLATLSYQALALGDLDLELQSIALFDALTFAPIIPVGAENGRVRVVGTTPILASPMLVAVGLVSTVATLRRRRHAPASAR